MKVCFPSFVASLRLLDFPELSCLAKSESMGDVVPHSLPKVYYQEVPLDTVIVLGVGSWYKQDQSLFLHPLEEQT